MSNWNFDDTHYDESVVTINFNGYYQPARWYLRNGDPGYPEEGDDIREVVKLEMFGLELEGKELAEFLKTNPGLADAIEQWVKRIDFPSENACEGPDPDEEYDRRREEE